MMFMELLTWTGNWIMGKMSKMNRVILKKKLIKFNWSMKVNGVFHKGSLVV